MYIRVLTVFFVFFLFHSSTAAMNTKGLWIVRYALQEKDEIENILQYANRLAITDLYVQVRASGKFFFNSESNFAHLRDNDAFKNFIELRKRTKQQNIRLHAWINVLNIWSSSKSPPEKDHIFYKSKMSILRCWGENNTEYNKLKKLGVDGYFLDPADKKNFAHLKTIIKILIEKYGVDGIHLDYFRYPVPEVTASPSLRSSFILEHYIDPETVMGSNRLNTNFSVFDEGIYKEYFIFLEDKLTNLLANLQLYIKTFNQGTILSIAVKPSPYKARTYFFQNWPKWLEMDLCNYVIIMNYVPETFDKYLADCKNLGQDAKIIIGIAAYNQDEASVLNKIEKVKRSSFKGYTLFSYNSLKERKMLTGF